MKCSKCNKEVEITAVTCSECVASKSKLFEFDKQIEFILGRPNFWCASMIVPYLRAKGQTVDHKAEAEQAAGIYFMLGQYEKHGTDWFMITAQEISDFMKEL